MLKLDSEKIISQRNTKNHRGKKYSVSRKTNFQISKLFFKEKQTFLQYLFSDNLSPQY